MVWNPKLILTPVMLTKMYPLRWIIFWVPRKLLITQHYLPSDIPNMTSACNICVKMSLISMKIVGKYELCHILLRLFMHAISKSHSGERQKMLLGFVLTAWLFGHFLWFERKSSWMQKLKTREPRASKNMLMSWWDERGPGLPNKTIVNRRKNHIFPLQNN